MKRLYVLGFVFLTFALTVNHGRVLKRQKRQFSQAYRLSAGSEEIIPDVQEVFTCDGRDYGYYADVANDCQIFHVCVPPSIQFSFFCPNGTIFDQRLLVCQHPFLAIPCQDAERYYVINQNFGETDNEKLIVV